MTQGAQYIARRIVQITPLTERYAAPEVFNTQGLRLAVIRDCSVPNRQAQIDRADRYGIRLLDIFRDLAIRYADDPDKVDKKSMKIHGVDNMFLIGPEPIYGKDSMFSQGDIFGLNLSRQSYIDRLGGRYDAQKIDPMLKPFLPDLDAQVTSGKPSWDGVPSIDAFATYGSETELKAGKAIDAAIFPATLHTFGPNSGIVSDALIKLPAVSVMFYGSLAESYEHRGFYQNILDAQRTPENERAQALSSLGLGIDVDKHTVEIREFEDRIDVSHLTLPEFERAVRNSVNDTDFQKEFLDKFADADEDVDGSKSIVVSSAVLGCISDGSSAVHNAIVDQLNNENDLPNPAEYVVVHEDKFTEGYLRM